ncbi:helix-turn-helix domain-containing protein [Nocardia sp. NPDC050406]|uniref:helix-turn-helix domain-containing protein n=1 Tax=Nocardia sp. NPDC050406 TaxID=3364318 RepID=UPI0037A38C4F
MSDLEQNATHLKQIDCWMSTEEVAERLKIPPKTLSNWASLGKGPRFAKIGRFRRYKLSELKRWEQMLPYRGSDLRPPLEDHKNAA